MARTEDFWNSVYRAFDPAEILVGERGEKLYCDREHNPLAEMIQSFRPSLQLSRPPIAFFTGHRGSGKSSLLLRLINERRRDCFVVYFDIEHNLDSAKTTQIDLLFLLGAAIHKAAEKENLNPDPQFLEALTKTIEAITIKYAENPGSQSVDLVKLAKGALVFTASMFGTPIAGQLAQALLEPITITTGVTAEIARHREIEPQVQQIINAVNLIIADVQTKANRPLLVVVDGLDKIQSLDQAKLIFLDSRALKGPLCRIVYTVPMVISTTPAFKDATQDCKSFTLPNVKIFSELDETTHDRAGYKTLTEVVEKRLNTIGVECAQLFEDKTLDKLIQASGGVMRYMIQFTQSALMAAERLEADRVNAMSVSQALSSATSDLTEKLKTEHREELRNVKIQKLPSNSIIGAELLHGMFILAYRNGHTWYYPHPLLWESL